MTDYTNTYPDLANVEDWLNAKGYTGEAGACHNAMDKIREQAARIAELEAALNGAEQAMTVASQALNLYQAINPYDGGNRAGHAKAEIHGSLAIVRAALEKKDD
jgi:hypothetical protein